MSQATAPVAADMDIDGLPALIKRMDRAETVEDWSYILADYVGFGNVKLSKHIAIFNLGAASDCPNLGTEKCQVDKNNCYAKRSEHRFPYVLEYRQRQEYLWDSIDPETFAYAFLELVDRKENHVHSLRLNQAGDFRVNGDIVRANVVAGILQEHGIQTYTYTASSDLDWSLATNFAVNASNPWIPEADREYIVVEDASEIPNGAFVCPGSCGPCRRCFRPGEENPGDVYEILRA